MRALLPLCLAACSLALSGCTVVYTAHPLVKSGDAVEEPELSGVWVASNKDDKDDSVLCIQKSGDHAYGMTIFDPESKLTEIYRFNLVRLNDLLFADMVFEKMAVGRTEIEAPVGSISHHVIVKLDISENDLAYSPMNFSAIQERNKEGYYPPVDFLETDDAILLTTSTDDLRQFISLYADTVFSDSEHLTRKTIDEATDSSTAPCGMPPPP